MRHAVVGRCTLLARGGDRTGRTQLSTRPVYIRLPDVERRPACGVGAAAPATPPGEQGPRTGRASGKPSVNRQAPPVT